VLTKQHWLDALHPSDPAETLGLKNPNVLAYIKARVILVVSKVNNLAIALSCLIAIKATGLLADLPLFEISIDPLHQLRRWRRRQSHISFRDVIC